MRWWARPFVAFLITIPLVSHADARWLHASPAGRVRGDGLTFPPACYDTPAGRCRFAIVSCPQHRDGIPVFEYELRRPIHNMAGSPPAPPVSSFHARGRLVPSAVELDQLAVEAGRPCVCVVAVTGKTLLNKRVLRLADTRGHAGRSAARWGSARDSFRRKSPGEYGKSW